MDSNNNNLELNNSRVSRTDLEIYTNVALVGKNCAIMREVGRHAETAPFTPYYESLHKALIVGTAVECYDRHSGETCLLIFYGSIWAPSVDCNLVLPLIASGAGIEVSAIYMQHAKSPSKDNHSTHFK